MLDQIKSHLFDSINDIISIEPIQEVVYESA